MSWSLTSTVGLSYLGHLSVEACKCCGRSGAVNGSSPRLLHSARHCAQVDTRFFAGELRSGTATPRAQVESWL